MGLYPIGWWPAGNITCNISSRNQCQLHWSEIGNYGARWASEVAGDPEKKNCQNWKGIFFWLGCSSLGNHVFLRTLSPMFNPCIGKQEKEMVPAEALENCCRLVYLFIYLGYGFQYMDRDYMINQISMPSPSSHANIEWPTMKKIRYWAGISSWLTLGNNVMDQSLDFIIEQ